MFEHFFVFILDLFCGFLDCSYLSFPVLVLLIKNSFFMKFLSHKLVLKSGHLTFVSHVTLNDCGFIWVVTTLVFQGLGT